MLETERVGQGHHLLALDAPAGVLRTRDHTVGLGAEVNKLLDVRHVSVSGDASDSSGGTGCALDEKWLRARAESLRG